MKRIKKQISPNKRKINLGDDDPFANIFLSAKERRAEELRKKEVERELERKKLREM